MSRKQLNRAINSRKQINTAINNIILVNSADPDLESDKVEDGLMEDYKKLNDKCDVVISRIKDRKDKKKK